MDQSQETDEMLVEAFKKTGDYEVLDTLFGRYIQVVRNVIYPMILNHSDADDLTQEVFVRAAKGLSRFRSKARFSTWLYRIAMNTAKTFIGRKSRRIWDEEHDLALQPGPAHLNPARQSLIQEQDQAVENAMNELSPRLKAAVNLMILQDRSVSESARIEGCTTATMYWRLHQARKILKNKLNHHLDA